MMKIKRTWFHILAALAEETRHGADIQRRVSEQSDGDVTLYPVTLYGALEDLEEAGLIEERPEPAGNASHNERRRYYRISRRGRKVLADETTRLEHVTRVARAALARRGNR